MLEFKIPNDTELMLVLADYLKREAGVPASELRAEGIPTGGYAFPNSIVLDEYVAKRAGEMGLVAPCACTCIDTSVEETIPGLDPTEFNNEEVEIDIRRGPTPPATETVHGDDPTNTPGVELADGLPWDARIHGSGKTKLAKVPHGWKLKRKPKDQTQEEWEVFVASVEAELREAMAASPANPIETGPTPPATEPDAATVFGAVERAIPGELANNGTPLNPSPTNFVELNLAITAAGIAQEAINAAVNAAGLQNYMLLPARTDLIPFVAGQLGLGPVVEVPTS